MQPIILRPNATPLYGFLSFIQARLQEGETLENRRILDCGAGGTVPPLSLFAQHGLECWGIDSSPEQLREARSFAQEKAIPLQLREGDMRGIPFDDASFDVVYEHYSMCHLCKADTRRAVREMYRVLKPGGLCFLGVISDDSWPTSIFGDPVAPGEYRMREHGQELTLHSVWSDEEADRLVQDWNVLEREKRSLFLAELAEDVSMEKWMALHAEAPQPVSQDVWRSRYLHRARHYQYVHLYYYLRKPPEASSC